MGHIIEWEGSKETRDELLKQAEAVEEELEEIETVDDAAEWIENNALDIERIQSLGDKGWETVDFEITVAWGGPAVWVRTDGVIKAAWAGTILRYKVGEKARKGLELIYQYLSEL